jgi:hypothetical protein
MSHSPIATSVASGLTLASSCACSTNVPVPAKRREPLWTPAEARVQVAGQIEPGLDEMTPADRSRFNVHQRQRVRRKPLCDAIARAEQQRAVGVSQLGVEREICCLTTAVIVLPAVLMLVRPRSSPRLPEPPLGQRHGGRERKRKRRRTVRFIAGGGRPLTRLFGTRHQLLLSYIVPSFSTRSLVSGILFTSPLPRTPVLQYACAVADSSA